MTNVKIADLKAHLSRHLRSVKGGETIVVLDRDTPIARIVPVDAGARGIVIRPRKDSKGRLSDVPLPPRPRSLKTDPVALLLEDRNSR